MSENQEYIDEQRMRKIFDVFSTTEGAILVRGPTQWFALPPGNVGDVLVIGAGGVPEWTDPANVNFGG